MKCIILEIIPSSFKNGDIIQLSAIKINNDVVIDRFDYRLNENKVKIKDFLKIISYDKDSFIYKDSCDEIIDDFKKFIEDYKLIIIDNGYTELYLKDIDNKKEYINDYLNIPYTENMIDELIKKYNLEPSNYIVDLLFESMINESNNKL